MFALLHLCLLLVSSLASETAAQTDTANPEGSSILVSLLASLTTSQAKRSTLPRLPVVSIDVSLSGQLEVSS